MRISFTTVLPAFVALASWTAGFAQAQGPSDASYPRDLLDYDSLDFGFERRELFIEELTTRELIDELAGRLERRGNTPSKIKAAVKPPPQKFGCPYCGTKYDTPEAARACAQPQIKGGCKVNAAVQQVRH